MPGRNGKDTGCNITRPERELTSYAGAPLREESIIPGESSSRGKAMDGNRKISWCALCLRAEDCWSVT